MLMNLSAEIAEARRECCVPDDEVESYQIWVLESEHGLSGRAANTLSW